MANVLATISGVALAPGVSRNNRLYTREAIAKAVARAQERISDGTQPLTVLTHHEAGDDSSRIIGRITGMSVAEDGSARFTADIADTAHGETVAKLIARDGAGPFLAGMSIRGAWTGKVRRVTGPAGQPVETADGLEFDGIDPTRTPGVPAAGIDAFAWAKNGATETTERVLITESVQEGQVMAITEETTAASPQVPESVREALRAVFGEPVTEAATPALSKRGSGLSDDSGRSYADPGYQKDGKQRYDLTTRAKAKAAWAYVNQPDNAKQYTAQQLKRVKGRIRAALKKFGVTVAAEGWTIDPAVLITEAIAEYAGMDPECAGSYSLSATNGPTTVTVCSYGLDPADLQVILVQACKGAGLALQSLDLDMDADIDVPGADAEDTDDDADDLASRIASAIRGESAESLDALIAEATGATTAVTETAPDPAPVPDAANREEEAPVTETTTEAAATAPAAAFTQADIDSAVAAALAKQRADKKAAKRAAKATESAPAAPVTETAAPGDDEIARMVKEGVAAALAAEGLTETVDQKVARLVREQVTAAKQQLVAEGGGPGRKGLVTESGTRPGGAGGEYPPDFPVKDGELIPMEKWSEANRRAVGATLQTHVLGDRSVY